MTRSVKKIAAEVSAVPEAELDELLAWPADFESRRMDSWGKAIAADSKPGEGCRACSTAREDVAAGWTRPLLTGSWRST